MTEKKLRKTMGTFNVIGRAQIYENTFVNETSESGFDYARFSMSIDAGKHGRPTVQGMGGYFPSNPYPINVFINGNKEEIAWELRNEEEVLKKIPDFQKITVGVNKDENDKTIYNSYLSWYDAVDELRDLEHGSVVNVRGNIVYKEYNGNTQAKLEVTSVVLSSKTEEDFRVFFQQNVVIDSTDCFDKSRFKDDKEIDIKAYVFDYEKGIGIRPFIHKYKLSAEEVGTDKFKAIVGFMTPKKGQIIEVGVQGRFLIGSSKRKATLDDYGDEIKALVEAGYMDESELLDKEVTDGNKSNDWYINGLQIRKIKKEGQPDKLDVVKVVGKYTAEDLILPVKEEEVNNISSDDLDLGELNLEDLGDLVLD